MDEFPTLLGLAEAIRDRRISPTEVLDETLTRIDALDPALNAIIWRDDEDARARARAAEDRLAAGGDGLPPFLGVPIPIKDLDDVEGWPTTFGSAAADPGPTPSSALVVERLDAAGFVLCGRSNTPEFGPITAAENLAYGISRNPWNTDHTPGGSSGGAAAATAAGIFAVGHANDGGGSIRIPASCCGLVGHKASRARVPDKSVSWEGAAVQGVVTHTIADTAAVFDAIATPDPLAWWHALPGPDSFSAAAATAPPRLRVALLTEAPLEIPVDPECAVAARRAAEALGEAGHEVVEVTVDFAIDDMIEPLLLVISTGLAAYEGRVDWDRVEPHNRHSRSAIGEIDTIAYARAVTALQVWTRHVAGQWGGEFDILVTPTMPIQPAPAGQILAEAHDDPTATSPTVFASVMFTIAFNFSGLPAISLPIHQAGDSGLPVGVQVVAGPGRDDLCFQVGAQLEQLLPWSGRHPDLGAL